MVSLSCTAVLVAVDVAFALVVERLRVFMCFWVVLLEFANVAI